MVDKDIIIEKDPVDDSIEDFFNSCNRHWAIFAAAKIGLFEFLNCEEFKSLKEIREGLDLKIKERNLLDFLDVLYINNNLAREGKGLNSKYKNKNNYFVKSNPKNLLNGTDLMERKIKRHLSMDTILKTGKNPSNLGVFEDIYSSPEQTDAFLRSMGVHQFEKFILISEKIDFSKYKTVCDIGGCLGNFLINLKKTNPHLECTNFDLGQVKPYFEKYIKENGMEGKINFITASFFEDEFPKSDVIVMGNILHDWSYDDKIKLMKKAYSSLNENGIYIVIEDFVSENRDNYAEISGSYTMLLECIEGYDMTREEISEYSVQSGFSKIEFLKEKIGCDGAILYK